MSTVAWDGKFIAADTQATSGNIPMVGNKLHVVGNKIVGSVGVSTNDILFRMYLNNEITQSELKDRIDDDFRAIVIEPSKAYVIDDDLVELPINPPYAIGSGRESAYGAMYAGRDACMAVQIACQLDIYSSAPVDVIECDTICGASRLVKGEEPGGVPPWQGREIHAAPQPPLNIQTSIVQLTCVGCGLTHSQEPTVLARCNDCWIKHAQAIFLPVSDLTKNRFAEAAKPLIDGVTESGKVLAVQNLEKNDPEYLETLQNLAATNPVVADYLTPGLVVTESKRAIKRAVVIEAGDSDFEVHIKALELALKLACETIPEEIRDYFLDCSPVQKDPPNCKPDRWLKEAYETLKFPKKEQ